MLTLEYPRSLITDASCASNDLVTKKLFSKDQYTSNDLVSLSWLQKGDIIKITPLDNEEDLIRDERYFPVNSLESRRTYRINEHSNAFNNSISNPFAVSTSTTVCPYFGSAYSNACAENLSKPSYSYTHLIFMAIESTPNKCMTVNQIYNWCESNFPFFKHSGTGWKNSLRHNLSINKSFRRLPRDGRVSL